MAKMEGIVPLDDSMLDEVVGGECYLYLNGACAVSGPIDTPVT